MPDLSTESDLAGKPWGFESPFRTASILESTTYEQLLVKTVNCDKSILYRDFTPELLVFSTLTSIPSIT